MFAMMASRRDSSRSFDCHSSRAWSASFSAPATRSGDFLLASVMLLLLRSRSYASSSRGLGGVAQPSVETKAADTSRAPTGAMRVVMARSLSRRSCRRSCRDASLTLSPIFSLPRAPSFSSSYPRSPSWSARSGARVVERRLPGRRLGAQLGRRDLRADQIRLLPRPFQHLAHLVVFVLGAQAPRFIQPGSQRAISSPVAFSSSSRSRSATLTRWVSISR